MEGIYVLKSKQSADGSECSSDHMLEEKRFRGPKNQIVFCKTSDFEKGVFETVWVAAGLNSSN